MNKPNFFQLVLKHWMNLSLLGGSLLGTMLFGWPCLLIGGVLEVGILWIMPDIPSVQRSLTSGDRVQKIERQRWYYLKSLWELNAPETSLMDMFVSTSVKWEDLDFPRKFKQDRIETFRKMCRLLSEIRELQTAKPEVITNEQLLTMDEMINGWLSIQALVLSTQQNRDQINSISLISDFAQLKAEKEKSDPLDKALQIVLGERLRAIAAKSDSVPKMERQIALANAQADNIVQRIEATCTQARMSGAMDTTSMLDPTMSTSVDDSGFDEMAAATEIRGMVSGADMNDSTMWDSMSAKLGVPDKKVPALGYTEPVAVPYLDQTGSKAKVASGFGGKSKLAVQSPNEIFLDKV